MDGIHDVGGMHGFGRIAMESNEPLFHEAWQPRAMAMAYVLTASVTNIDAFRHAIERLDPVTYLTTEYYARWLLAMERLLVELGYLAPGEAARGEPPSAQQARSPRATISVIRQIDSSPHFAVGDGVVARNLHPPGHTRVPRYVRGRRGVIERVHPACVFPDTHAHGRGESPQYLYTIRFAGEELWGSDAEPDTTVSLDLFESYLEDAR